MPDSFPPVSDDIAFELLILHAVAERGQALTGTRAAALRTSALWEAPGRLHRTARGKRVLMHVASALVIASTLSLTPATALPAWAQRAETRMTVVDVETGKALADVVLRDASGNTLARSKADGKLTFTVPAESTQVTLERAGYQSVTLTRAQLGTNNLVSMRKASASTSAAARPTPQPTVRPTAQPTAQPTVKPTAKPTAKPKATPTAKPKAAPTAKPTERPAAQAKPAPTRKPETAPRRDAEVRRPLPQSGSRYVVKRGDTLWDIASGTMGNPLLWSRLYEANRSVISRPSLIYPGQTLVIPSVTSRSSQGKRTVRRGDTLWDIAQSVYGNPLRWKDLYEANRSIISNPNRIYPGQTLVLPR